jgi:hypothetical protein
LTFQFHFQYSTGLAAPAIAAGLSALAPTLGTLIPVIGASGFAAAASAAGTVAGSVAVAASFGGDYSIAFISLTIFSNCSIILFSLYKDKTYVFGLSTVFDEAVYNLVIFDMSLDVL